MFVFPLGLDGPADQCTKDLEPIKKLHVPWGMMLGERQEVIAGSIIGKGGLWLIIALDTLMPEFCSGYMINLPILPGGPNAPLSFFPVNKEIWIQHANLFDYFRSHQYGTA